MPELKVFATPVSANFAVKLALHLNAGNYYIHTVKVYSDGQVYVRIPEKISNDDVVIVGNTQGSRQFEELCLLIHTIRQQNARRVIVVIPYFGAGRQDRAKKEGDDVLAKMHASILSSLKPDWILMMDLHNEGIRHFFDDSVRPRELYAEPVFVEEIENLGLVNFVIASADVGRLNWARSYAEKFGVSAASLDQRREGPGRKKVFNVVGDVAGKNIVLIDDIVDSGGTVIGGAKALKSAGAFDIHFFATHLVLSGDACDNFQYEGRLFKSKNGTDTIGHVGEYHGFKIGKRHGFRTHSVIYCFADYIRKILS